MALSRLLSEIGQVYTHVHRKERGRKDSLSNCVSCREGGEVNASGSKEIVVFNAKIFLSVIFDKKKLSLLIRMLFTYRAD
jgi:hypothetical protein